MVTNLRGQLRNNVRIAGNQSNSDPMGGFLIIRIDVRLTPKVERTPLTKLRFNYLNICWNFPNKMPVVQNQWGRTDSQ